MHISLRQPGTGKVVGLKVGFSWFFLLLTPFYGIPLFLKGLWEQGLIMLAIGLIGIAVQGTNAASFVGLILIAAAIFYEISGNKFVARRLLIRGWKPEGTDEALSYARSKWRLAL